MSNFGTGDANNQNNYVASGVNLFWTSWQNLTYSPGTNGRITSIGARWGICFSNCTAPPSCASVVGHNAIWFASGLSRAVRSNDLTANVDAPNGAWMDVVANATFWQTNQSYYMGFWRTAGGCSMIPYRNGQFSGYSGKSNDDGDITGGTNNWAGATAGGFFVQATVTPALTFVKRAGTYAQAFFYVKRAGVWSTTPSFVYKKIAGVWTLVNLFEWLQKTEHHIPEKGFEILADIGEGLEPGWVIEGEPGWFGNTSDKQVEVWNKEILLPGQRFTELPFEGRYNTWEPEEVVEARLQAYHKEHEAEQWERYAEASYWHKRWQPDALPSLGESFSIVSNYQPVDADPEPILVPCGCG